MQFFKETHIRFMKYKLMAFAVSGLLILAGIVNMTKGKRLNYGIDFAGGTLIQIRFKNPVTTGDLRQQLSKAGLGTSKIQEVEDARREFLIRTFLPELEEEEDLEVHEIMGNRIIDTLKTEEDRISMEKGLLDLNNMDLEDLTAVLEASFSATGAETAKRIIDIRESSELQGTIENFDQLQAKGISPEVIALLKDKSFLGSMTIKRRETVGPQVGADLRRKATQATIWALIGMLIYIGIRFKFAYGVSAVLTLAHDVLITLGIFSFTSREINLPVIAAILAIVGYSLNDTIVIFDRVRDNLKSMRRHDLEEVLDISINQTLSRSIITSGTTSLTVMALFLFGGEVINDFAFTLIIGIIVGAYSSIYQSCPILYYWNKFFKPKKGMGK